MLSKGPVVTPGLTSYNPSVEANLFRHHSVLEPVLYGLYPAELKKKIENPNIEYSIHASDDPCYVFDSSVENTTLRRLQRAMNGAAGMAIT